MQHAVRPPTRWCAALFVALSACNGSSPHPQASPEHHQLKSSATATPPAAPRVREQQISFNAMGTRFQFAVFAAKDARPALDACRQRVVKIESEISEWQPSSNMSALNNASGGTEFTALTPSSFDVLSTAMRVATSSGGAFDPTWATLHGLYDFRTNHERVPSKRERKKALTRIGFQSVEFVQRSARITKQGTKVGTGGVGKGYALDQVTRYLRERGFENHLLQAGGQIYAGGERVDPDGATRPFRVGVRHPRVADTIGFVTVQDASVSTSGDYERWFVDNSGTFWHHIIDPKTALPARHHRSVTLVTKNAAEADALSTAVFVMSPILAAKLIERWPGTGYVAVDSRCELHIAGVIELTTFPEYQSTTLDHCLNQETPNLPNS